MKKSEMAVLKKRQSVPSESVYNALQQLCEDLGKLSEQGTIPSNSDNSGLNFLKTLIAVNNPESDDCQRITKASLSVGCV